MVVTQVWPTQVPLQFDSALCPLLDSLHEDVAQHSQALRKVRELKEKYQLSGGFWPDCEASRRLCADASLFDTVLKHVLAVDELCMIDHVLIPRERLSEAARTLPNLGIHFSDGALSYRYYSVCMY